MSENPYQSPEAPRANVSETADRPSLAEFLGVFFSFRGRIPRCVFWGAWLPVLTGLVLVNALMTVWTGEPFENTGRLAIIAWIIIRIPLFWALIAIPYKRWHDYGKSGVWFGIVLVACLYMAAYPSTNHLSLSPHAPIQLVVAFLTLWILSACGLMRGTVGPNKYGPDRT